MKRLAVSTYLIGPTPGRGGKQQRIVVFIQQYLPISWGTVVILKPEIIGTKFVIPSMKLTIHLNDSGFTLNRNET
jgi:hypothetical protein